LEGLASGAHEYIEVLNPTQLWYSGDQHTFQEYFAKRPKHEILENHLEGNFTGIQRAAAEIMLCEDTVHFAGGLPASSDASRTFLLIGPFRCLSAISVVRGDRAYSVWVDGRGKMRFGKGMYSICLI
jgi:hypothetical protein